MNGLKCELVEQPGSLVVKMGGQMGLADMQEFDRNAKLVAGNKAPVVVLDMSGVEMISSAGIGGLLRLQKTMSSANRTVRLAALPVQIAQVLDAARLTELFKITNSVADALH